MNVLDLGQFCGFIHEPVANHFDLCTFSGTSLLETRIFKLTKPEALAEEFVTSMGTNFSRMHHWTDRLASFPWKPRDRTGSSEIVKKMISQGFQLSSLSLSFSSDVPWDALPNEHPSKYCTEDIRHLQG